MSALRKLAHAWGALAAGVALGAWLAQPGLVFAAAALVAAGASLVVGRGGWRTIVPGLVGVAGGIAAANTALAVRRIETAWPVVREDLLEEGRAGLDRTLGEAVSLARRIADAGLSAGAVPPERRFPLLERALRPGAAEHGIALFDGSGRAVAWAGRHRLRPVVGTADLVASITGFYAVLSARRQAGEWTAVGQVLLAADSAVPDREHTVAERFERRTGTELAFFPPGGAPQLEDVFDYCLPECRPAEGVPDTLFSVQIVPPPQGTEKLRVLDRGGRWVATIAALVFVAVAATAGAAGRYVALAGAVGLLIFTPAGERLGAGGLFSPAPYFSPALGPASASAGALALIAALVTVGAAGLWRGGTRPAGYWRLLAMVVGGATPIVVRYLARGITPPVEGTSLALWMTWEMALTMAGAALLVTASVIGSPWTGSLSGRAPRLVSAMAVGLTATGLVVWQPDAGWGPWFVAAWIPVAALTVRPLRTLRGAAVVGLVAGTMAAAFTWEAVLRGRLALGERDAERLGAGADPIGAGLLEALGRATVGSSVPATGADLYRLWGESPLSRDDYPAVLAAWDSAGRMTARLELASLDLPASLVQAIAGTARASQRPLVESFQRVPGTHYVLAVPHPTGGVTTVGIGPLSRVFAPLRLSRFLRGERARDPPYELFLAEPTARDPPAGGWRREGWVIRGERALAVPGGGTRRVHLGVTLRDFPQHVIRGVLVVAVNLAVLALLWWAAELLAGRADLGVALRAAVRVRSYRARLALMLGVFFVAPTVGFAGWSVARLGAEAQRGGRLLTRQTLRDAAPAAREIAGLGAADAGQRLGELAGRLGADLVLYDGGRLAHSSVPVLEELGLLDPFLPPEAVRHLLIEDDVEAVADVGIGGRRTRVAYRVIGGDRPLILAAPRLLDDAELLREQEDLVLAVLLATVLGLAAAAALAGLAARALAEPVNVLRSAAEAFGRGGGLPTLEPEVPQEFVPVVQGLQRMAADVRASQAALEAARQRTAAVVRSVATGVIALDRDLRVTIANPRAVELLGVPLGEGTSVREATAPAWRALWDWAAAFLRGETGEPAGAGDEGRELVVGERRFRALIADLGDHDGCVVALDDTTDLAHAVRVLAWGELARQVAHEIKNPLTPIRLGVQHLERAYRDRRGDFGSALERTARQILAEIERLDAIARAFARFGAPPAEAGPLRSEDLGEVARETAQLYALGGDVRVEVEAEAGVRGRVRRDELKEVFVNLIENARNARAARVTIALAPAPGDDRVLITLRDDGSGIAAEHVPRIFEPRFSTTTSGTGLGLAICKRLTESWGGSISVDSVPGKGTVVTLVVPS